MMTIIDTLPTESDIKAFQIGYSDAAIGFEFGHNPYPKWETEWHHWNAGYVRAYDFRVSHV